MSEKQFSPERSLEMARPRRGELEVPELTPEEKARLRALLEQAKQAEEENRLEDALALYTQLKQEFLAIKEKKEKEKRGSETTITAKTPEGKEISFDMKEIREHWAAFYRAHGLEEMADALPETISLTPEQIARVQELVKQEGFNHFLLLPQNPDQYLPKIKEETSDKPLPGLPDEEQYTKAYLWDEVKKSFPSEIKTQNRPEAKAYLVFQKASPEVDKETINKSAQTLRQELKEKTSKASP